MAEDVDEEMADLVARAGSPEDPAAGSAEDPAAEVLEGSSDPDLPKPKKKKRGRPRVAKSQTLDELDSEDLLRDLPKPEGNIKGLGDLYAKFGVGDRPEFRVHLYRTYPKIGRGGMKMDGFYDEYDIPITEQQIQAEYGGGQYRITVVGPHPTSDRLPKIYGSHSVSIAGDPIWDRKPRSLQGATQADDSSGGKPGNPPPLPMPSTESPKLAEAALSMFQQVASAEREERRRLEEKMDEVRGSRGSSGDALVESERRRADDMIRVTQERAEADRRAMQERMDELRREQLLAREKAEMESSSRPSFGQELAAMATAGLFKNSEGDTTRVLMEQILSKHRDEVAAMNAAHQSFISSLREGHQTEIAALRSAHTRELAAEREASKSREERIEERLRSEREERERDRVRHKEAMDERDRHWKDRLEGAKQIQESSWESRHQMLVATNEQRIAALQQELDRVRSENYDLKGKQEEKGDIMAQLAKMRDLQGVLKDFGGAPPAAAASGGIGLSGSSGDEWKTTLAEGISEQAPRFLEALFGGGGGPQQQPQQQQAPTTQPAAPEPKVGDVIDTPHGRMEVVIDPNTGQPALAPKEALDRHRQQVESAQGRSQRLPAPRQKKAPGAGVSAVQNLADGLPKRVPPWEGGGESPPPAPRMATRKPDQPVPSEPAELSNQERQALKMIAKEVHDSVGNADEPEDFVHKITSKYPAAALQQVIAGYTDQQIIHGVAQVEPQSRGVTPAGRQFMAQAFQMLRRHLQ